MLQEANFVFLKFNDPQRKNEQIDSSSYEKYEAHHLFVLEQEKVRRAERCLRVHNVGR